MINSMIFANLVSTGTALPKTALDNQQLLKFLKLPEDWIVDNIGVKKRQIVSGEENSLYLAILAAEQAITNAGYDNQDLDLIVVATATPEYQFPGISCLLKDYLGIEKGYALDLYGGCGGFISALNIANNAIQAKQSKNALIIGVDTLTRVISWEDPISTLFGDGAGAVILSQNGDKKILDLNLKTSAKDHKLLSLVNSNISSQIPIICMEEKRFINAATELMQKSILELLNRHNLSIEDLNWIVPQQIHIKVLNNLISKLRIKPEKLILTIEQHANTGAASIPLALEYAIKSKLFKPKDKILLLEVTAGLTVGTVLIENNTNLFHLK